MTFALAREQARAYWATLSSQTTLERFNYTVDLAHSDGSFFHLTYAFVHAFKLGDGRDFVAIFPEHHDMLLFDKEDILSLRQSKRVPLGLVAEARSFEDDEDDDEDDEE